VIVPKATVDEDRPHPPETGQIRRARKLAAVEAIADAK
jgi:hypothetical protein